MSQDRIEKHVTLRAPRAKVWQALSDAKQFGKWFGAVLEGPFEPGKRVKGQITIAGFEHIKLEMDIERVEPEHLFSYRWHPYAVDPKADYSSEPKTLVEFRLEEKGDGTLLTVVESGFQHVPEQRRAEAFRMNDGGWAAQLKNIERYVT